MKEHKEVSALLQQAKQERRCCYGTSDAQRRALKRRLHAGELVSPYKNLYADRTLWNTMTREQQSLQVIRALSAIHPQWVFAGLSAACVYGLQHNYSLHDGTVHIASKSGIGGGDEARLNRMELTGIYWNEGDQGVLVKKGTGASYNSAESFAGKTVAAQNGTNQQIMAEEQLPESTTVELVTKIPDGVNMVKTGRIDGLVVPKTVYDSILAENDDLEIADFAFDFEGGNYIASVKGEDALTAKIQEMIDTINAEGLYQQWVDEIQK